MILETINLLVGVVYFRLKYVLYSLKYYIINYKV